MRLRTLATLFAMTALAIPTGAAAQLREPEAGSFTLGGDVGFMVADDDDLHVGFTPAIHGEFYVTPRLSVRALGGWSRNRYIGTQDWYLDQYRGTFSVIYNWEGDLWHPFVAAGVGVHRVRHIQDGTEDSGWFNRGGVHVGAGVEYFARPKLSIKAEGLYHRVDSPDEWVSSTSGFALSIGLKRYF